MANPPRMNASTAEVSPRADSLRDSALAVFRTMLLARILEDKLSSLYRSGKIMGGVFLGKGQEALSASLGFNLRRGDIFAPLIRDQAGRLAFGDTVLDTLRTYLGSSLGSMRGRDGNIHRGRPAEGYYAMISHLGAMIPVVAGGLLARRFRGESGVVGATCIGDGGSSTGAFHEGLNVAAVEKLPLVLVTANNQYAYSTPTSSQFACKSLVDKAIGYGIPGVEIDGTDLRACLQATTNAVRDARDGGGPQLIVANLLRLVGHGEHDDGSYVDPALRAHPVGRDCLRVATEWILAEGWSTPEELATWRSECETEVQTTAARVLREPAPNPADEEWVAIHTRELIEDIAER